MTDIAKPEFRKSSHRPVLRTQLSVPNVADIPTSKNLLKSITLSGHEPFSVSFTQKFSYRDQPPSPGTIFLGCSLQEPEPGVLDTCTPALSAALLGRQLSSSVTSINSLVQEGQTTRFKFVQKPMMKDSNNYEQLSVPNLKSYRRSSLAIQSTNAPEYDSFSPYCNNTAYYHPSTEVLAKTSMAGMPNLSNTRGYFLGGTVHSSNSSHVISSGAIGSGQVSAIANTAMGSPSCAKNKRKAVLTVDAKTTEILIASESICALFRLKDKSLIGKKLAQVFPVENSPVYRKTSTDSRNKFTLEDGNLKKVPYYLKKCVVR